MQQVSNDTRMATNGHADWYLKVQMCFAGAVPLIYLYNIYSGICIFWSPRWKVPQWLTTECLA